MITTRTACTCFWYDELCAIDPKQIVNYGGVGFYAQAFLAIPVAARTVRLLESSDQALVDVVWASANLNVLRTRPAATRETQLVPLVHSLVAPDPRLTKDMMADACSAYAPPPPSQRRRRQASSVCVAR